MPRSVSQLREYEKCPYGYYLARVERVWKRPAAWLPQGTALHAAAEAWEKSERTMPLEEMLTVYTAKYDDECAHYLEKSRMDLWFPSGRYGGQADIERRYDIGAEQVAKYRQYYESHPEETPWRTPDGELGVELHVEAEIGGVAVQGYVDMVLPDRLRDNKSGNHPGEPIQLQTYALMLDARFGFWPRWGDFWMGKTGKPSKPVDLHEFNPQDVISAYQEMDDGVKAERFDPKPSRDNCFFCPVKASCEFSAAG